MDFKNVPQFGITKAYVFQKVKIKFLEKKVALVSK